MHFLKAVTHCIVLWVLCPSGIAHRVMNRKQTLGKPDQRDLNENLAATHGLAHMIQECRKLFRVSICEHACPLSKLSVYTVLSVAVMHKYFELLLFDVCHFASAPFV